MTLSDQTSPERRDQAAEARGALPNLIVIGAQKCGTTALHSYLALHPEIAMSKPKELDFFIVGGYGRWDRGEAWYRERFDPRAPVRGEASPNYTAYPAHEGVPARMHALVPDAKLIYIVRDPIERIAAHWMHEQATGRHRGPLRETLLDPHDAYIPRSMYAMQLEQFLEYYPLERILVLEQNDLRLRREATMRRVYEFAGVDPDFTHPMFRREWHRTRRKTRPTALGRAMERIRRRGGRRVLPPVFWTTLRGMWPMGVRIKKPDVRSALDQDVIERLREDARRFERLVGREFPDWSLWR